MTDHKDLVESLSPQQLRTLLQTIRLQRGSIGAALDDTSREVENGQRAMYLVDYDLIYRFIFQFEAHPESHQELTYLFSAPRLSFLIGPGTREEIARQLQFHERKQFTYSAPIAEFGLRRLTEILTRPNFSYFSANDMSDSETAAFRADTSVFMRALSAARPDKDPRTNRADAQNLAAITHLRRRAAQSHADFYPYLLTGTQALLDDTVVASTSQASPLARQVREAIYSHVLTDLFPDPPEAKAHALRMNAALQRMDAEFSSLQGVHHAANRTETDWEEALTSRQLGRHLRDQLSRLGELISDPVVYETQRVYDNAQLSVASLIEERNTLDAQHSPRRILDLVADLSVALDDEDSLRGNGLGSIWDSALQWKKCITTDSVIYRVTDKGLRGQIRTPYLEVELQLMKSPSESFFVIRWANRRDPTALLQAISEAYLRHSIDEVELILGAHDQVHEWTAVVPFTFNEVREALAAEQLGTRLSRRGSPTWLRFNHEAFDIFAVIIAHPRTDADIGVFVDDIRADHLVHFYRKTATRFVFRAWLEQALASIATDAGRVLSARFET